MTAEPIMTDVERTILEAAANLCETIAGRIFAAATAAPADGGPTMTVYALTSYGETRARFKVAHETLAMALGAYKQRIAPETEAAS